MLADPVCSNGLKWLYDWLDKDWTSVVHRLHLLRCFVWHSRTVAWVVELLGIALQRSAVLHLRYHDVPFWTYEMVVRAGCWSGYRHGQQLAGWHGLAFHLHLHREG